MAAVIPGVTSRSADIQREKEGCLFLNCLKCEIIFPRSPSANFCHIPHTRIGPVSHLWAIIAWGSGLTMISSGQGLANITEV